MSESLFIRAGRWKKAADDAATGPLIVAQEIVELGKEWKAYRKEAGGLRYTAFLKRYVGHPLCFFKARAEAVEILGEAARRYIHHDVAQWIVGCVTEEYLEEVKQMLHRESAARGGHPLTAAQAKPLVIKIIGKSTAKPKRCRRCAALEARIRELEHSFHTAAE